MRILDMRAREDFDNVLQETLASGWSALYQRPIDVQANHPEGSQQWFGHDLLGGFFVERPSTAVRAYLRDGLRYTPKRTRLLPQWLLATAFSSRPLITITSTPAFSVSPGIPNATSILVVPGNQRIRIFDFARGVVRVVLKGGFSPTTMAREIEVRRNHASQPWALPILSCANDSSWFEEKIIDAYALPRCPPWFPRPELENAALHHLECWVEDYVRQVSAHEYVDSLLRDLGNAIITLIERFPKSRLSVALDIANALARHALKFGSLELTPTHGDFQAGNLLVRKADRSVVLIDWEHSAERWKHYDRMVLGLGTRSPRGLSGRWRQFVSGKTTSAVLRTLPSSKAWRLQACALVALEDLHWYMRESLSGPYTCPSRGLSILLSELREAETLWS